jgi:hypothetical protein
MSVIKYFFKYIVQPKKMEVKRGTNRFVSTAYTIAGVFLDEISSLSVPKKHLRLNAKS